MKKRRYELQWSGHLYRCRNCGEYLDLHDTHHGSHMKDTENGAVECGAIDKVGVPDLLDEIRQLRQSKAD